MGSCGVIVQCTIHYNKLYTLFLFCSHARYTYMADAELPHAEGTAADVPAQSPTYPLEEYVLTADDKKHPGSAISDRHFEYPQTHGKDYYAKCKHCKAELRVNNYCKTPRLPDHLVNKHSSLLNDMEKVRIRKCACVASST